MTESSTSSPVEEQASRTGRLRPAGAGVLAGIAGIVATVAVASTAVSVLPASGTDAGTVAAVTVVAVTLGVGLGVRYRERWPLPALVAGGLTGAFLFLRGQAFLAQGEPVSYPLLFGVPGAVVAVAGALGGGWVGGRPAVGRRLSPSRLPPLARAGLVVAVAWTGIQLLVELGVAAPSGAALDSAFAGTLVATVVGFPVAALFAVRYGRRAGIDREDWDYTAGWRPLAVGLTAGALTVLVLQGVGFVLDALGWSATVVATFGFLLTDLRAGGWVLALFVLAHVVVAPVAEELAWRGVVQTALVRAWSPVVGVAVTAALFTAKHALLDFSVARVPSVLVLAVVLGVVRHRWGTTASTVAHAVANGVAVATLVAAVL